MGVAWLNKIGLSPYKKELSKIPGFWNAAQRAWAGESSSPDSSMFHFYSVIQWRRRGHYKISNLLAWRRTLCN